MGRDTDILAQPDVTLPLAGGGDRTFRGGDVLHALHAGDGTASLTLADGSVVPVLECVGELVSLDGFVPLITPEARMVVVNLRNVSSLTRDGETTRVAFPSGSDELRVLEEPEDVTAWDRNRREAPPSGSNALN